MSETTESYNKRMTELKAKIDKLLEDEKVSLIARLHITETGIMPVITFVNLNPENHDIILPKKELVVPK